MLYTDCRCRSSDDLGPGPADDKWVDEMLAVLDRYMPRAMECDQDVGGSRRGTGRAKSSVCSLSDSQMLTRLLVPGRC